MFNYINIYIVKIRQNLKITDIVYSETVNVRF